MLKLKCAAVLLAVVMFFQCILNYAQAADIQEIQFYINSSSNSLSNNIRNTLLKRTDALKINLSVFDANRSQAEQNKQVRKNARPGVPMIIDLVNAQESAEIIDVIKQLKPVTVFVNEVPPEADLLFNNDSPFWYVGTNNQDVAQKQATMVVEYLMNSNRFDLTNSLLKILILNGGENNPVSVERTNQLKDQLNAAHIHFKIQQELNCAWSYEHAFNLMSRKYASKDPDFALIVAHNDDMALGAISALQEAHELDDSFVLPPAFGIGASSESINALAEGDLKGTIRLDYMRLADLSLAISLNKNDYRLLSKLVGDDVTSHVINVPCNIILSSKENN